MFEEWYKKNEKKNIANYCKLLSFPSISTDPSHEKDVRACAEWLFEQLTKMGLEVEIWGDDHKAPTLFAHDLRAGEDKETLLLYCHYDVQPVDPLDQWITPPFEPSIRDNDVYARGACDNKGQLFYTLLAIKGYLELKEKFDFNLKLVVEGEEESGSGLLTEILEDKKEKLQADHLLIIDSGFEELARPAISIGCRGIVCMGVSLKEADFDLHSGQLGNVAYNPNRALAELLASLYDKESGKVAIEGFYDDCVVLDEATKDKLSLTFDKEKFKEEFGFTPRSKNPWHDCWLLPTLEINGIAGGYAGAGFKTVIPAQAEAKLSCRIAAGQDPEKVYSLVEEHLKKHAPKGMKLTVTNLASKTAAILSHPDRKIVKVVEEAYKEVFAKPIEMIMIGGSIPIGDALARVSGADVVLVGVALAGDHIHAPNERFGLDRLELGYLTLTKTFALLSQKSYATT